MKKRKRLPVKYWSWTLHSWSQPGGGIVEGAWTRTLARARSSACEAVHKAGSAKRISERIIIRLHQRGRKAERLIDTVQVDSFLRLYGEQVTRRVGTYAFLVPETNKPVKGEDFVWSKPSDAAEMP